MTTTAAPATTTISLYADPNVGGLAYFFEDLSAAGRALVTEGALVGQGEATQLAVIQQISPMYVNFTQPAAEVLRLRAAIAEGKVSKSAQDGQRAVTDSIAAYRAETEALRISDTARAVEIETRRIADREIAKGHELTKEERETIRKMVEDRLALVAATEKQTEAERKAQAAAEQLLATQRQQREEAQKRIDDIRAETDAIGQSAFARERARELADREVARGARQHHRPHALPHLAAQEVAHVHRPRADHAPTPARLAVGHALAALGGLGDLDQLATLLGGAARQLGQAVALVRPLAEVLLDPTEGVVQRKEGVLHVAREGLPREVRAAQARAAELLRSSSVVSAKVAPWK